MYADPRIQEIATSADAPTAVGRNVAKLEPLVKVPATPVGPVSRVILLTTKSSNITAIADGMELQLFVC